MQCAFSLRQTIKLLSIVLLVFSSTACKKNNEVKEVEVTKRTALEMYTSAKKSLDGGAWDNAIRRYAALRRHYPFGHYTEQGMLELAYAQYRRFQMEEAIVTLNRFVKNYPAHDHLDYAYYLKGLIYFNSERGFFQRVNPDQAADRNQENIQNAFTSFKDFLERYPDSEFAPDARKRMIYLKNQMAAYELRVGKYYLRRQAPIAALNRAKFVLESYQDTPAVADSMALMVEAYKLLGEDALADQSKDVLAQNYPSHEYLEDGSIDLETELISWSDLWPF